MWLEAAAALIHTAPARKKGWGMRKFIIANLLTIALAAPSMAQAPVPPVPAPQAVPKAGPVTKAPYAPQALLPGGIVMPLFPAGSPFLNAKRVSEAEVYTMEIGRAHV